MNGKSALTAKAPERATIITPFDFVPQGDGTFKAIPRKPVERASVALAAKLTGIETDTLYRLYKAGFVRGTQASPRKILLDMASLSEHLEKAADPEFWTAERVHRFNLGVPY